MKSKLKFDLDADNVVMISAHISESDDVRDKLAKKFVEGFETTGNLATVFICPWEPNSDKTILIYPSGGDEKGCKNLIRYSCNAILENLILACSKELEARRLAQLTTE